MLVSESDFIVVSAVLLPLAAVEERWSWNAYVKGWRLMMNGPTMQRAAATTITAALQRAALSLD